MKWCNCKIMKKFIIMLFFLIVILFKISCENDCNCEEDFSFPLMVGNEWNYKKTWKELSYIVSIGNKVYFDSLTMTFDVSVNISRKLTILDSIDIYEMIIKQVPKENNIDIEDKSYQYYQNQLDGLYLYGYKGYSGALISPKVKNIESGRMVTFPPLNFYDFLPFGSIEYQSKNDSIYYENPPIKSIPYPMEIGYQWTYREHNNPFFIGKEVIDYTKINVMAGIFNCYVIKWSYNIIDITIYDYFSKEGLIYRRIEAYNFTKTDEIGNELYTSDFIIEYELVDNNL